ncbi:DUF3558 domain-containing protein [Nocardia anaemiae]|uniref:DUF3558 domain-containing protein n=1 Tax=Nocardia anaemiae TaxID=263910 RepID=UPI000A004DDF|nr:DUF3558 domain-containing protein [Nocardia anaemiae]
MKHTRTALALASIAILSAGCTGRESDGTADVTAATTQKPSNAVSVKAAPTQPKNSRSPVAFDPCTEIDDATITTAGFDPGTRERADQIHDNYAFIGCTFDRKQDVRGQTLSVGSLTITSGNIPVDEFRTREGSAASEIKVNSREALTYRRPAEEACYVVMNGPDATINVRLDSSAALTDWRACDHVQEIAEVIESALPRNK